MPRSFERRSGSYEQTAAFSDDAMSRSIVILIAHFGPWPVWIDFFIESCRSNSGIDWIIFSDAEPPENRARNVRHVTMAFEDYRELLDGALGVRVGAEAPYKLCEIRPALAFVHSDLVRGYDFVGTGDLDVIYGDIRAFYDGPTLDNYDLFSSHADRVSGHFTLMRNTEEMVTAFQRVRGWKKIFRSTDYHNFDERAFYNIFRPARMKFLGPTTARCFFREAYSTPGVLDDMRWYWERGRLTNEYYPHNQFMYLHFMSWHSSRWYGDLPNVQPGTPAPWSQLGQVVKMDWREARTKGFMISPAGIGPIERPAYP